MMASCTGANGLSASPELYQVSVVRLPMSLITSSCTTSPRSTSGVLAFWATLPADHSRPLAAVQHRTANGGAHVHVLAARCDLETGQSLNIAPPGWEQTDGPLVEACNLDQGWSRPNDPARARDQQPGHRAYLEAAELRAGIAHEADPRDQIRDYLCAGRRARHGAGPGRRRRRPAGGGLRTCRARARTA